MVSLTRTKVVIGGTIAFYYHSPNAQAPAGPLRSTWAGPQPVETCEAVERLLSCRLVDGRCATPEEVERFPEDDGRLRRSLVQHGHPRLLFHYCCFTSVLILSRNSVNVCWIIVTHHVVSLSYITCQKPGAPGAGAEPHEITQRCCEISTHGLSMRRASRYSRLHFIFKFWNEVARQHIWGSPINFGSAAVGGTRARRIHVICDVIRSIQNRRRGYVFTVRVRYGSLTIGPPRLVYFI